MQLFNWHNDFTRIIDDLGNPDGVVWGTINSRPTNCYGTVEGGRFKDQP